jgi:hypothetical protein
LIRALLSRKWGGDEGFCVPEKGPGTLTLALSRRERGQNLPWLNVVWGRRAAMSDRLPRCPRVIPHHREQDAEDFANTLDVILWQIDKKGITLRAFSVDKARAKGTFSSKRAQRKSPGTTSGTAAKRLCCSSGQVETARPLLAK